MAPATATIVSPVSSSDVARSFHSSRPTLDPLLYHCHRRAPPLCSIVTGFDLWPTIPYPPSSALLLLSQPLLAGCLTATSSSSPAAIFSASFGLFSPSVTHRSQLSPLP
ncbi:hypothetical protein B296_00038539 [Ensete ventricosum]|uniref:Uncharacterized protein n=1 Tax=Ensete ventricosum TaxID=4639 RepID=A0A426ZW56_ENSVE|nr:hypothetical protein B296_00038539 [Ensete ventricosum]